MSSSEGVKRQEAEEQRSWTVDAVFRFLSSEKTKKKLFGPLTAFETLKFRRLPSRPSDEKKEGWLLALITSTLVRGADDALTPRIVELRESEGARSSTSVTPLPELTGEECENFLKFVADEAPTYSVAFERAKKLVERKWGEYWQRTYQRPLVLPNKLTPSFKFATLVRMEAAWLERHRAGGRAQPPEVGFVEDPGVSREPWISQAACDYFGIALSGGGIRSATYNLGLLQALAEKGVLRHADYLSTVSGGGYIGGFWTAWRSRRRKRATPADKRMLFPVRAVGAGDRDRERPEVRHLREFSRFLVPRVGFAESETWTAVTAVLGGMLMSLLVTVSAVAVFFYLWHLAFALLIGHGAPPFAPDPKNAGSDLARLARVLAFGALTLTIHLYAERRLWRIGKLSASEPPSLGYVMGFVSATLAAFGWYMALAFWNGEGALGVHHPEFCEWLGGAKLGPREFGTTTPALVWLGVALALVVSRGLLQFRLSIEGTATFDRSISRCLGPALLSLGVAVMWCLASYVGQAQLPGVGVGVGAAGATGLFLWLFEWLKKPVEETRGTRLLERLGRFLRPHLPQVAAGAAALLFLLGVAMIVHDNAENVGVFGLALGVVVTSLVWFDTARSGLHEFYRARLARCFLGAARARPPDGGEPVAAAATVVDTRDELRLGHLRRNGGQGPVHLICCTANNLSGDVLGSLYRGGRSSVLSPFGVAVGNFAAPRDELGLSAALTASGASFNSHMGGVSMRLGPAVAFVMCALNLRLGLWTPHPLSHAKKQLLPGWNFFLEALGRSRSDQVRDRRFLGSRLPGGQQLHLSDGGHFENLALYELVRRHCRHIILSDATADAAATFEDLGNAIRLVREDFGVEIELDVSPLRPNEQGFARQHAVVGTIHYDGLDGTDKGVIIYFKPVLTGDEPVDVLEFRTKSPRFPHDGTTDQFYDEAQWESYRRLGQHSAAAIVSLPTENTSGGFLDKLFHLASQRLQVVDEPLRDAFLELTARCQQLTSGLRADTAMAAFLAEFFPEAVAGEATTEPDPVSTVHGVMMVAQMMEDVWFAGNLDERWSHSLNDGWMNYFRRWTATRSFRTWWPILRPIYHPGFREFVGQRFDIHINEPARGQVGRPGARLVLRDWAPGDEQGLASVQFRRFGHSLEGEKLVYELELGGLEDDKFLPPIQVALLVYEREPGAHGEVSWFAGDAFLVPALSGAGIESRFLDALVQHFVMKHPLRVKLGDKKQGDRSAARARKHFRSPAARRELVQKLSFYKSRGFRYELASKVSDPTIDAVLVHPRVKNEVFSQSRRALRVKGDDVGMLKHALQRTPPAKLAHGVLVVPCEEKDRADLIAHLGSLGVENKLGV